MRSFFKDPLCVFLNKHPWEAEAISASSLLLPPTPPPPPLQIAVLVTPSAAGAGALSLSGRCKAEVTTAGPVVAALNAAVFCYSIAVTNH